MSTEQTHKLKNSWTLFGKCEATGKSLATGYEIIDEFDTVERLWGLMDLITRIKDYKRGATVYLSKKENGIEVTPNEDLKKIRISFGSPEKVDEFKESFEDIVC